MEKNGENLIEVMKGIPKYSTKGSLDPRVLEVVKQQKLERENKNVSDLNKEPQSREEFVAKLRSEMGWPNIDITTSEIKTEYRVIDGQNGTINLRVYSPISEQALPSVVFFHGGGFFGGSLETVENPCKYLAEEAHAVVVSVDYRLAPEHPYPAGIVDCYDAVKWVHEHADELGVNPNQIVVSGDSAGGNLAAVCSLMDRDSGAGLIKMQALIYPVLIIGNERADDYEWSLDHYEIMEDHHEYIIETIEGLRKSDGLLQELYIQDLTTIDNPLISPLLSESLAGMPRTVIITAEFDYLRPQAEAFARKLAEANVPTKIIKYCGMDHAFIDKIGIYPQAADCLKEIANELKMALI